MLCVQLMQCAVFVPRDECSGVPTWTGGKLTFQQRLSWSKTDAFARPEDLRTACAIAPTHTSTHACEIRITRVRPSRGRAVRGFDERRHTEGFPSFAEGCFPSFARFGAGPPRDRMWI